MKTVVYLIRHSKKLKKGIKQNNEFVLDSKNMCLSVEGEILAKNLCHIEELNQVEKIYSSDYARAVSTAKYLAEKLNYFLDIIKIAGPLIALGLGTVDFIKVIANGDADKEMKNAFKKFMIRLGAAALLFIIPIIIAFLLDIFMRPDSGYESDNPFCNVIDWNE